MAEIVITLLDPAGNRYEQQVDNYAIVRNVIPTFVKHLGLPTQLTYQLIPVGTRSKLLTDKPLVACGVRPGSELNLIPIHDVVFNSLTTKLYEDALVFSQHEQWEPARACLELLFRTHPDQPDTAGLRQLVPGYTGVIPSTPVNVPTRPVAALKPPALLPTRAPREVPQPKAKTGGGCFGLILVMLCLPLVGRSVFSGEPSPTRLTTDGSFKQNIQWSPDSKTLLFTRIHQGMMALWTMPTEGGEMKRLLPEHKEPHFDGCFSKDGKRIVYVYDNLQGTDGKLRINVCAADGSDDKTLIPHQAFEESPRWSPDGKLVLWVSTRNKNPDLYTVDAEGKNEKRLTSDLAYDLHPAWSPDGKQIAFASGRSGRQKIHVVNPDGSNVKKLTDGEFLDAWPAWRPDGKQIAFASNRTGDSDIWLMNADGSGLVNLTSNAAQDTTPAWSPDGKKIAFVSTRNGGSDIYVIEVK